MVVQFLVPSCCVTGAIAETVIIVIFASVLIISVIVLTFVIGISSMSLVNFQFFIAWADVNLVNLVHPLSIDSLIGEDVRFKIHSFLKGCLQKFRYVLVEPAFHLVA